MERWDPFRDMRSMREAMDRLFRDSWGRPLDSRLPDWGDIPVDVAEKDNEFVVRATIPGVRPEDIQVNVQGDRLTLRAESQNEQERKDERYVVRERYATSFYRTLALPSPVNTDKADASYDQGVLTLTLPKTQVEKSSQIRVHGGEQSASHLESGSSTAPSNA
ncbi:MAG TPA: Hsp20/alpha crystallin family protein [Ktedonobacterales bacterium]|jgi:HSP20 family protein